jgi:hypothetical protein
MRKLFALVSFVTLYATGVTSAHAQTVETRERWALDDTSSLGIGMFGYAMVNACCSDPALLSGLDLTFDQRLAGSSYGLRARTGAVLVGQDEIDGFAPHLEAGAFRRWQLGGRAALDASLMAGVEYGALDHKEMVERDVGPTGAAELTLQIALTRNLMLTMGAGYRISYAQNEPGTPAQGFISRHALAWSF